MDYRRISVSQIDALWELQRLYKVEIGEDEPKTEGKQRLEEAIAADRSFFNGRLCRLC